MIAIGSVEIKEDEQDKEGSDFVGGKWLISIFLGKQKR